MVAICRYISKKKKKTIKNHWFWQKRGVSKRAVSLMYLITNLRISWLELLEVADWEPYNKKLTFSLNFKFKKLESTISRFWKSSNLCQGQRWQCKRKCSVVSTSLLHAHITFIVSPKPCLNLCPFRWLNWSIRRVRSLTPSGS